MKSSKKKSQKKKRECPFGETSFVKSIWKTMKQQEKSRPEMALLHERLEGSIRLIGLTGGIASGKSTVAKFFQELKIPVIDADTIARQIVHPKTKAFRQIVQHFGKEVIGPDGSLDRARLGGVIFADESKRKLLESITHPPILKEIVKRVAVLKKKKTPAVIIDAALLFESGLSHHMHKNILVRADPEVQLKRLIQRDRLSATKAWQRIFAQMSSTEKEKLCDLVIDNSGSFEETHRRVQEVSQQLS